MPGRGGRSESEKVEVCGPALRRPAWFFFVGFGGLGPLAPITPTLLTHPPSRPDGRRGRNTLKDGLWSPLSPVRAGGRMGERGSPEGAALSGRQSHKVALSPRARPPRRSRRLLHQPRLVGLVLVATGA